MSDITFYPAYTISANTGNSIEASFMLNSGDCFYIMFYINATPGTVISGGTLTIEKLPIQSGGKPQRTLRIAPAPRLQTISVRKRVLEIQDQPKTKRQKGVAKTTSLKKKTGKTGDKKTQKHKAIKFTV